MLTLLLMSKQSYFKGTIENLFKILDNDILHQRNFN